MWDFVQQRMQDWLKIQSELKEKQDEVASLRSQLQEQKTNRRATKN